MTTATKITIFRIILVPLVILVLIFPYDYFNFAIPQINYGGNVLSFVNIVACIIFIIASISDFVDGYIARKTNTVSTLGKFLDPLADKLLVNSILILLASTGNVPVIAVIVMVLRDIFVDSIRYICTQNHVVVSASPLGKLKTVLQMVAIPVALLNNYPFEMIGLPLDSILIWFAALASVISGIDYFFKNKGFLVDKK